MDRRRADLDKKLAAFRRFIDQIQEARGWKPSRIAKEAGVEPSTVNKPYKREDWTWVPSLDTLDKISEAARIPLPRELLPGFSPQSTDIDNLLGQIDRYNTDKPDNEDVGMQRQRFLLAHLIWDIPDQAVPLVAKYIDQIMKAYSGPNERLPGPPEAG